MTGAWELDPMVALRPEPFGALAYHYGNRRLTFVRSPDLVEVVRSLGAHETVDDALSANNVDEKRWRAFHRALDALAGSEVIRRRG